MIDPCLAEAHQRPAAAVDDHHHATGGEQGGLGDVPLHERRIAALHEPKGIVPARPVEHGAAEIAERGIHQLQLLQPLAFLCGSDLCMPPMALDDEQHAQQAQGAEGDPPRSSGAGQQPTLFLQPGPQQRQGADHRG